MTVDIPIRNIYYMLAYSNKILNLNEYNEIGKESFENILELYSTILSLGVPVLIRGGLLKEYLNDSKESLVVRGKINLTETIKTNAFVKKKLVINYDEFSEDNLMNQIIKATISKLARNKEVPKNVCQDLASSLPYFDKVSDIELSLPLWKSIIYTKQNKRYQFILEICKYVHEHSLIAEQNEEMLLKTIADERSLATIFEKFIFELLKRETHYKATHNQIPWQIDDDYRVALPIMQTDIVLHNDFSTLIIDTKFYKNNMSRRFDSGEPKQLSSNLYQMFTYINNWPLEKNELIGGLVLYAKTTSDYFPNHDYWIKGKSLSVETVDLNMDFSSICNQLIEIADKSMSRVKNKKQYN